MGPIYIKDDLAVGDDASGTRTFRSQVRIKRRGAQQANKDEASESSLPSITKTSSKSFHRRSPKKVRETESQRTVQFQDPAAKSTWNVSLRNDKKKNRPERLRYNRGAYNRHPVDA